MGTEVPLLETLYSDKIEDSMEMKPKKITQIYKLKQENEKMKKRVLIYLNVTKESLIDIQEKVLLRYCKIKEWGVTKVTSDFEEMLEAVKRNEVDIVLVDTITRLSKDKAEVRHLKKLFRSNNVVLVSLAES